MVIKSDDLLAFLQKVAQNNLDGFSDVILPSSNNHGHTFFSHILKIRAPLLDSYRTVDPTKMLFYLARERMTPADFPPKKRIILGVKACDLKALELMDAALINQDFVDPAYKHWRENSVIVTSDCGSITNTCHCTLVDGQPYAASGFDLNLSQVGDSFVVTVGSDKGEALLNLITKETALSEATRDIKEKVDQQRKAVTQQLVEQNAPYQRSNNFSEFRSVEIDAWEAASEHCIGCGACTNICPTCYCLILNDETEAHKFVKERTYDSCQWNGYARVAGGGTPRPEMGKRFRNRYLCKFDYMPHNFGRLGCTGCGRCTEACAAEIDFREVVRDVSHHVAVT